MKDTCAVATTCSTANYYRVELDSIARRASRMYEVKPAIQTSHQEELLRLAQKFPAPQAWYDEQFDGLF